MKLMEISHETYNQVVYQRTNDYIELLWSQYVEEHPEVLEENLNEVIVPNTESYEYLRIDFTPELYNYLKEVQEKYPVEAEDLGITKRLKNFPKTKEGYQKLSDEQLHHLAMNFLIELTTLEFENVNLKGIEYEH